MARVRALAQHAGFQRAEAMTLHQAGDYGAAITCLLRSPRCPACCSQCVAKHNCAFSGGCNQ
jgi:hypothetical protein